MKNLTLFRLPFLLTVFISACQTTPKKPIEHFDAQTFVPPYKLIVPGKWSTETFNIPIEFAPSIPYLGIEELRFAPGWGDSTKEDYWTYSYLWYLGGKINFDAETMQKNLEAYYTGLVGRNIGRRKIPKEKLFPVTASFELVKTYDGDVSTFKGSVKMLDYMAQRPIKLNCLIHVKECAGKDNTLVFYEVSPQGEMHAVWNDLNNIWSEFQCEAK